MAERGAVTAGNLVGDGAQALLCELPHEGVRKNWWSWHTMNLVGTSGRGLTMRWENRLPAGS